MNDNTKLLIQAVFWIVMAAAVLALLLLPVPQPQSLDALIDNQPTHDTVFSFLDLTHTPPKAEDR